MNNLQFMYEDSENSSVDSNDSSVDSNDSTICKENKSNILLQSLDKFYSVPDNIDKFYDIVYNKQISLRIIDWYITNYSKKYNVVINRNFIVFIEYKSQLKAYTKKLFDPFCRRERIDRYYGTYKISTTIGQLNFFKWGIVNNIFENIKENITNIEQDMNNKNDNYIPVKLNKNKVVIEICFD